MTRKDYETVAKILAQVRHTIPHLEDRAVINDVVYELADQFQKDQPQFDRQKFLKACFKEN